MMQFTEPIPDYKNLDLSGEALQASARLEARAREGASEEMFRQLIVPLLGPEVKTVLEFGCGTAALSRRIAWAAPQAVVYATDKSEGMLTVARRMAGVEGIPNVRLELWDVLDDPAFPFPVEQFDRIVSSVVAPYLDDAQTVAVVERLSSRLSSGGILAFVEQDWASDAVCCPRPELFQRVLAKDQRTIKRSSALGLRPVLREAGLQVLPRRSFLWTDDAYGPYARELLGRLADAACDKGRISEAEKDEWKQALDELAASGDFYYGIVYHLVAGMRG